MEYHIQALYVLVFTISSIFFTSITAYTGSLERNGSGNDIIVDLTTSRNAAKGTKMHFPPKLFPRYVPTPLFTSRNYPKDAGTPYFNLNNYAKSEQQIVPPGSDNVGGLGGLPTSSGIGGVGGGGGKGGVGGIAGTGGAAGKGGKAGTSGTRGVGGGQRMVLLTQDNNPRNQSAGETARTSGSASSTLTPPPTFISSTTPRSEPCPGCGLPGTSGGVGTSGGQGTKGGAGTRGGEGTTGTAGSSGAAGSQGLAGGAGDTGDNQPLPQMQQGADESGQIGQGYVLQALDFDDLKNRLQRLEDNQSKTLPTWLQQILLQRFLNAPRQTSITTPQPAKTNGFVALYRNGQLVQNPPRTLPNGGVGIYPQLQQGTGGVQGNFAGNNQNPGNFVYQTPIVVDMGTILANSQPSRPAPTIGNLGERSRGEIPVRRFIANDAINSNRTRTIRIRIKKTRRQSTAPAVQIMSFNPTSGQYVPSNIG